MCIHHYMCIIHAQVFRMASPDKILCCINTLLTVINLPLLNFVVTDTHYSDWVGEIINYDPLISTWF